MSNSKFFVLAMAICVVIVTGQIVNANSQAEPAFAATDGGSSSSDGSDIKMALTEFDDFIVDCTSPGQVLTPSDVYVSGGWEMLFKGNSNSNPGIAMPREQFVDLNGDGLVDYYYNYVNRVDELTYSSQTCVYFNTGSGFEPEYQCYITINETGNKYYGDCAG